jgi:diacylglycerol kinase (ATP)
MCNYFSVGVDAEIALQFHQERESNPDAFTSRWMNLIHYARIGFTNALASQVPVARAATVRDAATGAAVPMEPDWEGCIVASVPCYQGGRDFWGKKRDALFRPSSFSDGLLEVMGVESLLHVGFVQIDLDRAIRVAQAKAIEIQLKEGVEMPVQVDGEPWRQRGPCRISITRAASYPMLLSPDATTVVAASGGATPVAPTAMTGSDASASSSSGGGRRGGGGVRRRSTVSPGAGALRQEATGTTTVHDECEREQEPHVASSSRAAAVAAATWNRLAAGAVASSSGAVRVAKGVLRRTRTV